MAQPDGAAKKHPAVRDLHSSFLVGSISEENSEDEIQGKADMQLEEKETRSLSPSSGSSDSTFEMGFDHIDGSMHNLRLETECCCVFSLHLQELLCYQDISRGLKMPVRLNI